VIVRIVIHPSSFLDESIATIWGINPKQAIVVELTLIPPYMRASKVSESHNDSFVTVIRGPM